MSNLPLEIFDYITNLLNSNQKALKQWCLVSKSHALRTQMHIFRCVHIRDPEHFNKLKNYFPDPSNSPVIHTQSLSFYCIGWFTYADIGWIKSLTNIVQLEIWLNNEHMLSGFAPFRNLSELPTKPQTDIQLQAISNLICSFPLLEDLHVVGFGRIAGEGRTICQPSDLPTFTGTLVLEPMAANLMFWLLKLPNYLCFRKIVWRGGGMGYNFNGVKHLVERCFDTLEDIDIACGASAE